MVSKALQYIIHPKKIIRKCEERQLLNWMPDYTYLKLVYWAHMGKKLDLKNPKTFNEKLQWLKLYNRNPNYINMVDKYEAKRIVAQKIGDNYIIQTLGVWNDFGDIEFSDFPNSFVLKTTHDSGTVIVCKDKNKFDYAAAKYKIEKALKQNFFYFGREWPYKNVKPRIIAEQYMELSSPKCAEYKFFCYNGKVKWVMVCLGEAHSNNKRTNDGYDADFNHLPVHFSYPNAIIKIEKPKEWDKLINFAEALAEDIPLVRVDTYLIDEKIYFGELTFFHDSGYCPFEPKEWDLKLGKEILLWKIKK